MASRHFVILAALVVLALPAKAGAQPAMPSAAEIESQLKAPPSVRLAPGSRVTVPELMRRPDLRGIAPSVDIHSINFAFGSALIGYSEYGKVENIAIAMRRMLQQNPGEAFLLEGHADAVGSRFSNQILSERRADSLRRVLADSFGIPWRALESVGYGEDYLLVPVSYAEWRNRRVVIRRISDIIIPF